MNFEGEKKHPQHSLSKFYNNTSFYYKTIFNCRNFNNLNSDDYYKDFYIFLKWEKNKNNNMENWSK